GHAPVGHVTTGLEARSSRYRRVESPQLLAASRIQRENLAPRRGDVHDTVNDDGRGLLRAMHRIQVDVPGELQLTYVVGVDLLQRAEALLVVRTAVREPIARIAVGGEQTSGVDCGNLPRGRCRRRCGPRGR